MLAPPSPLQRSRELLVGRDLLRLAVRYPTLGRLPRGDGDPVVVIPGFAADDRSLIPLRRLLARLGHDTQPVGLGRIGGDVAGAVGHVVRLAERQVRDNGRRPALVGWSLGGVIAREAARERPDLVRRVVTFGTPVVGGPSYTALARFVDPDVLAAIRVAIDERERRPIRTPITAVWSRNDGIVTPAACIDERSPDVEHVEVSSTHLGMGVDPDVWAVVADRLARR